MNACGTPNKRPNHRQHMIEANCPENCSRYPKAAGHGEALGEDKFIINDIGEICLTNDGLNCKKVKI